MELVSVIIPVYNAENSLDKCIRSILVQTYTNIEIIIINDGSTDTSGRICDQYAKSDDRITVIHQKNSGVSVSRNRGLGVSKGYYIQFIDADDYIENNMVEKLVCAIQNDADLVISGYRYIYKKAKAVNIVERNPRTGMYDRNEFLLDFGKLYSGGFTNSVCNKMYISRIIKKENISFPEEVSMGEDLIFNLGYFGHCTKVTIIDNLLYNYVKNGNPHSLTAKYKENLFENQKMLYLKVKSFLSCNDLYNQANKKAIGIVYTNGIISSLNNIFHLNCTLTPKERMETIKQITSDSSVVENIEYFRLGSIQMRIIGYFIYGGYFNTIYHLLKIKHFLRNNYTKARFVSQD